MTVADAYIKYEEMKEWYDSKVGAATTKIREIDRKISELTAKLANAVVGSRIYNETKRRIDNFIKKIKTLLENIMKFISEFELKIQDWITKKVKQIQDQIVEKQKQRAAMKAAALLDTPVELPESSRDEEGKDEKKDIILEEGNDEDLCGFTDKELQAALEIESEYRMQLAYAETEEFEESTSSGSFSNMFNTKIKKNNKRKADTDETTFKPEKDLNELYDSYVSSGTSSGTSSSANVSTVGQYTPGTTTPCYSYNDGHTKPDNWSFTDNEKKAIQWMCGTLGDWSKFASGFYIRNRKEHSGVDIAECNGTKIRALYDGKIVKYNNSTNDAGGRTLGYVNELGEYIGMCHLSKILVTFGATIKKGQVIAESGASGNGEEKNYGYHIHLAWKPEGISGEWANPRALLERFGASI